MSQKIIDIILFVLFIVSCVYCSDIPMLKGIFQNNHESA